MSNIIEFPRRRGIETLTPVEIERKLFSVLESITRERRDDGRIIFMTFQETGNAHISGVGYPLEADRVYRAGRKVMKKACVDFKKPVGLEEVLSNGGRVENRQYEGIFLGTKLLFDLLTTRSHKVGRILNTVCEVKKAP